MIATEHRPGLVPAVSGPILLGMLGMIGFSGTLPASRAAVPVLGGVLVGLGRSIVAAVFGAIYLWRSGAPIPTRGDVRSLGLASLGVVFGWPVLSALAMTTLPAAHGAVISGLIPVATALMAAWRIGERPSFVFWIACLAGVLSVCAFAVTEGAGRPQRGDILLLAAVAAAGFGYAEGAQLVRRWGATSGLRVVSWTLVIAAPAAAAGLLATILVSGPPHLRAATVGTWVGFGYVAIISAYAALVPWYAAMARGGVARIGQLQLIQPVVTLLWAAVFLGEAIHRANVIAALLVMASTGAALFARAAAHRPSAAAMPDSGLADAILDDVGVGAPAGELT